MWGGWWVVGGVFYSSMIHGVASVIWWVRVGG